MLILEKFTLKTPNGTELTRYTADGMKLLFIIDRIKDEEGFHDETFDDLDEAIECLVKNTIFNQTDEKPVLKIEITDTNRWGGKEGEYTPKLINHKWVGLIPDIPLESLLSPFFSNK